MREVIDVSQPVNTQATPWPGDVPFRREWTARVGKKGSNVNLGTFSMSAHLGTHADAPFHFDPEGARTEAFALEAFCGPAHLVAVDAPSIRPSHVAELDLQEAPRVLFKTRVSRKSGNAWSENFPPILPETMRALGEAGAVLVGTDAPSVDPADSGALPAHHAMARHGLHNLENLALAGVEPGTYALAAFPLKIEDMDAAPVRAVLQPLN